MNIAVMYHYVREKESWKGSVPISPLEFEKQLDKLSESYTFVSPEDIHKKNRKPNCVLTFDDSTKDQYENAFSIMSKKGIPGYFTVMSGTFQNENVPIFHLVHTLLSHFPEKEIWKELSDIVQPGKDMIERANKYYAYENNIYRRYIKYLLNFLLTPEVSRKFLEEKVFQKYSSKEQFIQEFYISIPEYKKMKKAGMTIGVHCVNHSPFKGNSEEYFKNEIEPCSEFINEVLGEKPQWYTPPFGGGEHTIGMKNGLTKILELNGFKGGFTTESGYIDEQSFWLKRFDCNKIGF